jgi:hypothetical protein
MHLVPDMPTHRLKSLLAMRPDNLAAQGPDSSDIYQPDIDICVENRKAVAREALAGQAVGRGWPTAIDFVLVSRRVIDLRADIYRLLHFHDSLQASPVWQAFTKDHGDLHDFVRSMDTRQVNLTNTRPG